MTGVQKVLFVAIGLIVALQLVLPNAGPRLPVSKLSALEKATAEEIREAERQIDVSNVDQWLIMAETYMAFGRLPEASYCFEQASHLDPASSDYLFLWGVCRSRMGDTEGARPKFQQAIAAQSSTAPYCWFRLGLDWLREERPKEAEEALRKASDVPESRLFLARLLMRTDRLAEARQVLDAALVQHPQDLRAVQMKSWALEELGELDTARQFDELALRCAERIARGDPSVAAIEQRLGDYGSRRLQLQSGQLGQAGRLDDAVAASNAALQIMWRENYALQLAHLEMRRNQPAAAIKLLEECGRRVGRSPETLEMLGSAHQLADDHEQARAVWEQATRMRASRPPETNYRVQAQLSASYRAAGDEKRETLHSGLAEYESGRLAFGRNQLDAARDSFEKAVQFAPQHALSWFYLGETLRHRSEPKPALAAYRKCLELAPDHGRARRAIALLEGTPADEP